MESKNGLRMLYNKWHQRKYHTKNIYNDTVDVYYYYSNSCYVLAGYTELFKQWKRCCLHWCNRTPLTT